MAETTNDEEALRVKCEGKSDEALGPPRKLSPDQADVGCEHESGDKDRTTIDQAQQATVSDPDKPYSAFTTREKWGIIVLISLASIFSLVLEDHITIRRVLTDDIVQYRRISTPLRYRPWPKLSTCRLSRSI
jgi:hypothetical protein